MRILTAATPWWGHLIESYLSAFYSLNHDTKLFQIMDIKQNCHKLQKTILPYPNYYKFVQKQIQKELLIEIDEFKPDLLLVFNYPLLYSDIADYLEAHKIKSFLLLGDSPFNDAQIINQSNKYNEIFCWDPYYVNGLQLLSGRTVNYLPHAGDEKIYFPLTPSCPKDIDLCFVGSASFGDNKVFRPNIIINLLNELFDNAEELNVLIQGDDSWIPWVNKNKYLKKCFSPGILSPDEVNILYNRSKAVLNIHHPQNILSAHMRTFEIALSGCYQLADYKAEIPRIFGNTVQTFTNIDEAVFKLRNYLSKPELENNNIDNARQIVLEKNTYYHRAKEMLSFY